MLDEITGEKKVCIKLKSNNAEYAVMNLTFHTHFFSCYFIKHPSVFNHIFLSFKILKKAITTETSTFITNSSNLGLFVFPIFLILLAYIYRC